MSITWGPSIIRQWILKVLVVGTFENLQNWYHKTTYTGPLSSPFSSSIHYLVLDASVNEFSGYHWDYYEFLALFPFFSESMFTKVEVVREKCQTSIHYSVLIYSLQNLNIIRLLCYETRSGFCYSRLALDNPSSLFATHSKAFTVSSF